MSFSNLNNLIVNYFHKKKLRKGKKLRRKTQQYKKTNFLGKYKPKVDMVLPEDRPLTKKDIEIHSSVIGY